MKKTFMALSLVGLLYGCSDQTATEAPETPKSDEPVLTEAEQLKRDAKEVAYNAALTEEVKKGTKVVIDGDVTYADKADTNNVIASGTTFTLAKGENPDVYWVENAADTSFKLNSNLKVYGTYEGVDKDTGIPRVKGTVVEVVDEDVTVESDSEKAQKEAAYQKSGEYADPDLGNLKVVGVGYNDEVGIDGTDAPSKPVKMGPVNFYVNQFHIIDIETNENSSAFFNGEQKVRAVIADIKSENTSEQDVSFYPDQAVIVTDTGEQIDSEMMMGGSETGGDFLGKVTKEGQVWWILKDQEAQVKNIKLIVGAPSDTNYNDLGEEKRLDFNILTWDEAIAKDKAK